MTLLVGLSGYARSGKNEAANALVNGGWRQAAFADKLRDFLYAVNPKIKTWPDTPPYELRRVIDTWGWEQAKDRFPEVRELLQRTGTEAGREILGENVWVNALFGGFDRENDALVVTDVRFPNEADAIRERGGTLIRVERPGVLPKRASDGTVHRSETALDRYGFDHVIVNDMSVEYLHGQVMLATFAGPQRSLLTRW
ncbi:deoxynucleoside monophosphate kinase [Streptomyces phage Asten]|nr:deoxynucleoside monophosphate kinase [Streptomyces phage Asten]